MTLLAILLCFGPVLAAAAQLSSLLNKHFDLPSSREHHSSSSFQPMNAVDPFPDNCTYVSFEQFSDYDCQNRLAVWSIVLNVCLADEKGSIKYSCENGIPSRQQYNDLTCTTLTSTTNNSNQCSIDSSGIPTKWSCDITGAYDYPEGNYFVNTMHQSDTCNAEILETTAVVSGVCFPEYPSSFMVKWPYYYYYPNSDNCEGSSYLTDLSAKGCMTVENTDYDDYVGYGAYRSYSNVVVGGDDDNNDDSLSGWKIAVIVVCSVIGFVLIVGVGYYFLVMKKKSEPMSSQAKADNLEVI
eukprot:scaffold1594_cov171-Ochromonas_danica.AAC.2